MSVEEAKDAVAELTGEVAEARRALSAAQGDVRGLELRVADGDGSVSALALVEARHAVEVGERRVAKLDDRLHAATEALRLAEAHQIVDGWEKLAPSLRAEMREAATRLCAARDEMASLVGHYNAAANDVQRALAGRKDPGGRFAMGTFGHRFAGSESLRPLLADVVVAVVLTAKPSEIPPGFPIDILPAGHEPRPLAMARHRGPGPEPVRPPEPSPIEVEAAVRAGRVQLSPFSRRTTEEG